MSPLITLQDELAEEEKVLRNEQEWFLTTQVKPSLDAIQKALLACQEAVRLQDDAKGALTLAISSTNNDTLKGFVTLAGSFIVKGDLTVKLPKLPVVKTAIHSNVPSNASVPLASLPSNTTSGVSISTSASSVATDNHIKDLVLTASEGSETSKGDLQSNTNATQSSDQSQNQPEQDSASIENNGATTIGSAPKTSTSGVSLDASALPPPPPVNTHQLMNSYRPPGHLTQPYLLEQLKDVQNHTAQTIFRLEDYWSRSSSDALTRFLKNEGDVASVSGESASKTSSALDIKEATRSLKTLLELIERHLRAAIEAMARPKKEKLYPFRVCDSKIFSPALSEDFVIEFYIRDSRLVCAAYALHLSSGTNTPVTGGLTSYLQQALPGSSTPASQLTPQFTRARSSSTLASSRPLDGHQHSNQAHNGDHATKSGQTTPRPPSPVHHDSSSATTSHPPPLQHSHSGNGHSKASPTSQPHHNPEHYTASGPPPNGTFRTHDSFNMSEKAVVLPPSNKIGQTNKGGVNKYRGKVATTIEDKVVQVESPKLTEISTRLMHAEGLCRRLLQFLALQESVAVTPI
ncbi:hypothetical protein BGZ76_000520 [Entomortierella beljakovae]|nr:hypothetical protein BGZ76_000520 [Entomortierella beljakovae]